jgi:hypothetical protein
MAVNINITVPRDVTSCGTAASIFKVKDASIMKTQAAISSVISYHYSRQG